MKTKICDVSYLTTDSIKSFVTIVKRMGWDIMATKLGANIFKMRFHEEDEQLFEFLTFDFVTFDEEK